MWQLWLCLIIVIYVSAALWYNHYLDKPIHPYHPRHAACGERVRITYGSVCVLATQHVGKCKDAAGWLTYNPTPLRDALKYDDYNTDIISVVKHDLEQQFHNKLIAEAESYRRAAADCPTRNPLYKEV